jgi:hypothetical protein
VREIRRADATASISLPILSNIFRKSWKRGTFGKLLQRLERVLGTHVRVAQRDDVGEAGGVKFPDDFRAAVADADAGEVDFALVPLPKSGRMPKGARAPRGQRGP